MIDFPICPLKKEKQYEFISMRKFVSWTELKNLYVASPASKLSSNWHLLFIRKIFKTCQKVSGQNLRSPEYLKSNFIQVWIFKTKILKKCNHHFKIWNTLKIVEWKVPLKGNFFENICIVFYIILDLTM